MKKILGFILTPIFHAYYTLLLILFHPVQIVARNLFGDMARKRTVDLLNLCILRGLYILGSTVKFSGFEKIPENRPIIIISNHQSMFDIPAIVHGFKKYYPKFISKIELSKYWPSISYNLRHSKSALIDRNDRNQSVAEIFKLGRHIGENNYAACIFPEGTRSKTGRLNYFKPTGINTLILAAPTAVIVPFVINGHSQFMQHGKFSYLFGQKITYTVLDPIEPNDRPIEELVNHIHSLIKKALNQEE